MSASSSGRIGGLKSRTGCKTCKIRRVKCGEERPICLRCSSTGRKCEFQSHQATEEVAERRPLTCLARMNHWPSTLASNQEERHAFEFYFERAAPAYAGLIDLGFWRGVIVHMCHSEPAIWDAVIALSSLHSELSRSNEEYIPLLADDSVYKNPSGTCRCTQQQAMQWYARSLSNIRTQINDGSIDTQVAVVSCILFTCYETLQGNSAQAYELYCQGSKLIHSVHSPSPGGNKSAFASEILPVYIRQGMAMFLFNGEPRDLRIHCKHTRGQTLGDFRVELYRLIGEVSSLAWAAGQNPSGSSQRTDCVSKQAYLLPRLDNWLSTVMTFGKSLTQSPAKYLLLMLHATTYIIAATCLTQQETIYDEHIERFKDIVQHASDLLKTSKLSSGGNHVILNFEMGAGLSLYHTILKCRDPNVRRRALQMSLRVPGLQGLYGTLPGGMLGAKVIELEEDNAQNDAGDSLKLSHAYPTEAQRIRSVTVTQDHQDDGSVAVSLRLTRNSWDATIKWWHEVEEKIPIYRGKSAVESRQLLFSLGNDSIVRVLGPTFSQTPLDL